DAEAARLPVLARELRVVFPLRPRPRVELRLAPAEVEAVDDRTGGHARAAVRDGLAGRELRQGLVPRRVERPRNAPGHAVDGVRLAPVAMRQSSVDDDDVAEAGCELRQLDRVASARLRLELLPLGKLLAAAEGAAPRLEIDDRTVVVTEVAQQPPESLGAARAAVGDDEDAGTDASRTRRPG